MQRIAILGGFGQLGSEIAARVGARGVPLSRSDADITNARQLAMVLGSLRPTTVVNCAAYNLVDRAEDDPERAFAVNAFGVRHLAQWCGAHDVPLMHVSTDYVFGLHRGDGRPWMEIDPPGPLSVYGGSKLAGEWFVRSLCRRYWIVRTCGLYGNVSRSVRSDRDTGKGNFVATMLRLGAERPELRVVNDQRCTPTSSADLADALVELLATSAYGLYHATNAGDCTWYEFAQEIFRLAKLSPRVIPITSAEYGAKARRPEYSVLSCVKLQAVIGRTIRPWHEALKQYLNEGGT